MHLPFFSGCYHDITLREYGGLLNASNPMNPYKDYTLVWALYCSGDLFIGNVTTTYATNFPAVDTHEQRGYYNAKAVIDWLHRQQSVGNVKSPLSEFLIGGDSAGAAGAIIWADQLLTQFASTSAAVIIDSPPIVNPDIAYSMVLNNFGACSSPLLSPALQRSCSSSLPFGLKDIALSSMANHPNVPYVYVFSKYDSLLWGYYCVYAGAYFGFPQITPLGYYEFLLKIIVELNQQPNFITFLIDSTQHTYTVDDSYLVSTTYGVGVGVGSSLLPLLSELPLSLGQSISSQCDNCAGLGIYPKVYLQKPAPAPPKSKAGPKAAAVQTGPVRRSR